jgi:clan AA aspartic protease (TIGR02281 family)
MTSEQIAEAQKLAREWKPRLPQVARQHIAVAPPFTAPNQKPSSQIEVPLKMDGGIFVVPVELNGTMTLDFAIDSGAADVSVPADVFSTLKRTGTIKESDFIGQRTYVLADGTKSQSATFTIRSLKVGGVVLENVTASVAPSQGSLLLGQSFLSRFKSWSIDNTTHELLLEPR